jgi:hypothetical protein
MTVGYSSIFPIENADEYSCSIHKYETGHSGLYLRVTNHRVPVFYLYFAGVRYLSGPPSWDSVNFELIENSDKDKLIAALRKIDFFDVWPEYALLDSRLSVYRVGSVSIVAVAVERLDKIPVWEGDPYL